MATDPAPLRDVSDHSGNSALHLLCHGRVPQMLDQMKMARIHSSLRSEIEQKIKHRDFPFVIQKLVELGCDVQVRDKNSDTATQLLVKNIYEWIRSPAKQWELKDYVRIFSGLLYTDDNSVIEPLIYQDNFLKFFKLLVEVQEISGPTDSMKELVASFRRLSNSAMEKMLAWVLGNVKDNLGCLKWFSALLEGVNSEMFERVFLDKTIQQNLVSACTDQELFVKLLLKMCVPVSNGSMLQFYVDHSVGEMVKTLVHYANFPENSGYINELNILGRSAVFYCRSVFILEHLLKAKHLDALIVDSKGHTVLTYLVEKYHFNVAKRLIDAFPDSLEVQKRRKVQDNWTVLFYLFTSAVKCVDSSGVLPLTRALVQDGDGLRNALFINAQDDSGRTALMQLFRTLTIEQDHRNFQICLEIIKFMIQLDNHQFELQDKNGKNLMMYAILLLNKCNDGECAKVKSLIDSLILAKMERYLNAQERSGKSVLIFAINELALSTSKSSKKHFEDVISCIIQKKPNLKLKDFKDQTPLIHAVLARNEKIVALLLSQTADIDINAVDKFGKTAAFYAYDCVDENAIVMTLISEDLLNLQTANADGKTLMHLAAEKNSEILILRMLSKAVNLNQIDSQGNPPIFTAIKHRCSLRIILSMIEHEGFDVSFHNSAKMSIVDVLQLSTDYSATEKQKIKNAVFETLCQVVTSSVWNEHRFDILTKLDITRHVIDSNGKSGVMFAAEMGAYLPTLKRLLSFSPASVNYKDRDGNTALHYCLKHNSSCVLTFLLLQPQCDIYTENNEGVSPLGEALTQSPPDIVEQFLAHKQFDVLRTVKAPDLLAVDLLMTSQRNVQEKSNIQRKLAVKLEDAINGSTWNVPMMLTFLAMKVAVPDVTDQNLDTCLHYTISNRQYENALSILKNFNPDINICNREGRTPFFVFIEQLASKEQMTDDEMTILDIFMSHPQLDVNSIAGSQTPLIILLERKNCELVRCLLSHKGLKVSCGKEEACRRQSVGDDNSTDNKVQSWRKSVSCSYQMTSNESGNKYRETRSHTVHGYPDFEPNWVAVSCAPMTGVEVQKRQRNLLFEFIFEKKDMDLFKLVLCNSSFDVNETLDTISKVIGNTLIHSLIRDQWYAAVEELLQVKHLELDVEDDDGDTPLFLMVKYGSNAKLVRQMLNHCNCDPTYENAYNQTIVNIVEEAVNKKQEIDNRIKTMIMRAFDMSQKVHVPVPQHDRMKFEDLHLEVEDLILKYKHHQLEGKLLSEKERNEMHFFLDVCLEHLHCIGTPHAEKKAEYKVKILHNYAYLLDELIPDSMLRAHLIANEVLNENDDDEISNKYLTKNEKIGKLLKTLMRRGERGYRHFLQALDKTGQGPSIKRMEDRLTKEEKNRDWYKPFNTYLLEIVHSVHKIVLLSPGHIIRRLESTLDQLEGARNPSLSNEDARYDEVDS